MLTERTPTAVYNADEKKLIGIFAYRCIADKFIFGGMKNHSKAHLANAIRTKYNIKPKVSQHPFTIAARNATSAQILEMGDALFILKDESLAKFAKGITNHFDSTRLSMYKDLYGPY